METSQNNDPLIICNLTSLLATRKMTLSRLSEIVGISIVNLSILKNGHARSVRYSTLSAICLALDCEVGELLSLNRELANKLDLT